MRRNLLLVLNALLMAVSSIAAGGGILIESGLKEVNKSRPAVGIFYYPGSPGACALGRNDDWDLRRIASYFDFVGNDVGGVWNIGSPEDQESIAKLRNQYEGYVDRAAEYGLGVFAHIHAGAPEWFLKKNDWYGASGDRGWWIHNDPKFRFVMSDPGYYSLVIDRLGKEVIGRIPEQHQPKLWWLESEPGWNVVAFDSLRNTESWAAIVPLWHDFLAKEFGDIGRLNRASGMSYPDFKSVSIKDDTQLVRVMVSRFASWMLLVHYQGQVASAVKENAKGTPVATRWCEMSAFGLDPRDFSRFDEVDVDYPGFTWYPGNPYLPYTIKNRALLGKASSNFSMIRFYGKPISCGELGYWRGSRENTTDTNIQGDFGAYRPFQPWELENLMYRCLYYNVGLFMLFNYAFPNDNISWSTHTHYPDTMKTAHQVIDDWNRIQPYASFGKSKPNEVGIIISRNARCYPITGDMSKDDHYYGDVWLGSVPIMEDPSLSYFDIMEEHAPLVTLDTLREYHGLIVYDVCLNEKTRRMIDDFARAGKPVLVIGAPRYVDGCYLPADIPDAYPVTSIVGKSTPDSEASTSTDHPLIEHLSRLPLVAPTEVTPVPDATVLAKVGGKPVFVVRGNVAYLSGVPFDLKARTQLYRNFLKWCGARTCDLYVSRFERAVVLQNYKSEHIRTWSDGRIRKDFPQTAKVTMEGLHSGQLYEAKGDYPWLAFHDTPDGLAIDGIYMDSCQVRVFQHTDGPVHPHFESVPDGIGFTQFMLGTSRLRGYFEIDRPGSYSFNFVPGMWGRGSVRWKVTARDQEAESRMVAEGNTSEIGFTASLSGDTDFVIEIIREQQ